MLEIYRKRVHRIVVEMWDLVRMKMERPVSRSVARWDRPVDENVVQPSSSRLPGLFLRWLSDGMTKCHVIGRGRYESLQLKSKELRDCESRLWVGGPRAKEKDALTKTSEKRRKTKSQCDQEPTQESWMKHQRDRFTTFQNVHVLLLHQFPFLIHSSSCLPGHSRHHQEQC